MIMKLLHLVRFLLPLPLYFSQEFLFQRSPPLTMDLKRCGNGK